MNKTRIEYLDYTWNPLVGCSGIGCAVGANCWARHQAKRAKHRCDLCYSFVPHVHRDRFGQPLHVKKPSRIGVCFMGDFFDRAFDLSVQASIYLRMMEAPSHRFLILTKQPQNIDVETLGRVDNLALGVSVNTKKDVWRIDVLRDIDAGLRFISFEPLYEDLGEVNFKDIGWAIIGAQTKPKRLPPFMATPNLIKQLENKKIPIFLKNNLGALGWKGYHEIPDFLQLDVGRGEAL